MKPFQNTIRTAVLVAATGCVMMPAGFADSAPAPVRGFTGWTPAATWEEAMLSGNGTVGAMVFGRPHDETIILNHARLYLPATDPMKPIDQAGRLGEIRELLRDGRFVEASRIPVGISLEEGYGGQLWTDPYMPALDIRLSMAPSDISDYSRGVNFETGEATVRWRDDSGHVERALFVSRSDTLVILRIKGTGLVSGSVRFDSRPYEWSQRDMIRENIASTQIGASGHWLTFRREFTRRWEGNPHGVEGVGRMIVKGGEIEDAGGNLSFRDAQEVLLLVRIEPVEDAKSSRVKEMKKALSVFPSDYDTLLDRHVRIHGELYNRVRLSLGGGEEHRLQSEALVLKARESVTPAMIGRLFDAARYNTLSATGIHPPNLQGIWNGSWSPPWSSDYTHNGNVQVSVSGLLCGNLPELMKAYFDYHDRRLPDYRDNARRLFGCRGIHIPSRTSSHGWDIHFNETWCMTFWTAGAGWAAGLYYDYYLYTGDRAFLKERAYPFMKEAALFYEDFLIPGEDGKYVFIPSYSPENNPGNSESQASINATMDVMVAKQLLRDCIAAAGILNTDRDRIRLWEDMLERMPDYEVNEEGALREWLWPGLEDNNDHRHVSHLYGLYERIDPEIAADPELTEGARRVIEERMKIRRRDQGGVMVFGMAQMAFVAANLGDAETVSDLIDWMSSRYWTPSLATLHDPGNLFNMDLSGGYPAAIIRALVYAEPGYISLLPALPASWEKGRIEGVLLRGQLRLKSLEWESEKIVVTLHSGKTQTVTLKTPGEIESVSLSGKGGIVRDKTSINLYRVNLRAGEALTLTFVRKGKDATDA